MEPGVGSLLRELRKTRGLGQAEVARRAAISRATLNNWETGKRQPRLPELEATLTALNASPRQRREALAQMNAPRALYRTRAMLEQHAADLTEQAGPMPHGGDLLRAMRLRRGWNLDETARQAGVEIRTLSRWERGEAWPNATRLHTLCFCLDAQEEEVAALTLGRFSLGPAQAPSAASVEEVKAQLHQLVIVPETVVPYEQCELYWLSMEATAWPMAVHDEAARILLSELFARHAYWLVTLQRYPEAIRLADRAIETLPKGLLPQPWWCYALFASSTAEVYRSSRPAPARGIHLLQSRLSESIERWPMYEAWRRRELAEYLALQGSMEEALALSRQACQIAARRDSWEEQLRKLDYAELLLQAGRPAEALPLLPTELSGSARNRIWEALLWVQALLETGDRHAAHLWLECAYALPQLDTQPRLRARADALAQRM
jgi:transcriptional regulator with XRE-family HTH domain